MRSFVSIVMALFLLAAACAENAPRTTSGPPTTSEPPASGPAVELAAARARWEANRPLTYEMRYHALGLFPDSAVVFALVIDNDDRRDRGCGLRRKRHK